ncbi:MAG: HypC/HybG/HupF family hydrogenase formation chaperone [Candidatus Bipolaricaulota bacterium]
MCLAIPGEVVEIEGEVAKVDINGVKQKARLDTISEEVAVGDYLLVHTGFAIKRLPPEEARETLSIFDEFIEANEELTGESEV